MSALEASFLEAWRAFPGLVEPEREYQFALDLGRKWRFDFAWPAYKVAVEMDGSGGRHHSFTGFSDDCDKMNAAVCLGWRVLRFTRWHAKNDPDGMVETVLEAIGQSNREC